MVQAAPTGHVPVMAARIVELLAPALAGGGTYVDCTLGLGGHARLVLEACPQARLVGIDRDADALAIARERLAPFGDRVALYEAVYDELPDVLAEDGTPHVQAIVADLGLSSLQIDRRERGFAYSVDAPLDMRMTQASGPTAADVLNTYEARDLARILRTYGEERFADRIARRIVAERATEPFTTSARLVQVLTDAIPAATRATGGHPAKRTFQALRIEVNRELEALEGLLPAALAALAPGGRFAVLSYHSLEDRLVKKAFAAATTDTAPRGLPVVPAEHRAGFRLLTRGAERPSPGEEADNPRAASARLRATERLEAAA
ncbi:16S rRNA (cytosine(1402)-N(4))-methyltransferase RsmH [Propioniciclava sinopodophylli]|uniref:Ribosomal RNA small subunit methyltransferase H n=1 Tax=Propioniciclava sinopodophylli TaxID=1837344 RepID=A0A4V2JSP8_9ACTN|nr:16S rRNA (cytosine(1402)-N(4))-methyltransferase RsmH [Propioniciclava sinopodophylli]TBT87287.1 16S rRNA (cytosine(1402)-N(4))-methyltransferase RsmH [Propioniciclava sinopodophylli]